MCVSPLGGASPSWFYSKMSPQTPSISSATSTSVGQAQQPESDNVRIEELERTVDFVQRHLKKVEQANVNLLGENESLRDLQDESLIENGERLQYLKEENERLKDQLAKSEEGLVQELQQRVKELEHTKSRLIKLHHDVYDAREKQADLCSDQRRVLRKVTDLRTSPHSADEIARYYDSAEINAVRSRELQTLGFQMAELQLQEEHCAVCCGGVYGSVCGKVLKLGTAEGLLEDLPKVLEKCKGPQPPEPDW